MLNNKSFCFRQLQVLTTFRLACLTEVPDVKDLVAGPDFGIFCTILVLSDEAFGPVFLCTLTARLEKGKTKHNHLT